MVHFPEVWNADLQDKDKFGFGCVESDILVEKISGNIDLATGNIGMKLRVSVGPTEADVGFTFWKEGKERGTRKGLYSEHSGLQSITTGEALATRQLLCSTETS